MSAMMKYTICFSTHAPFLLLRVRIVHGTLSREQFPHIKEANDNDRSYEEKREDIIDEATYLRWD